jgi:predicted enzyme related to lactoylglutathione lyase
MILNAGVRNWTSYFTVASADEAARTTELGGGTILLPPTDFGHDRIGVLADCSGAAFVVFEGETDP